MSRLVKYNDGNRWTSAVEVKVGPKFAKLLAITDHGLIMLELDAREQKFVTYVGPVTKAHVRIMRRAAKHLGHTKAAMTLLKEVEL